jgi:hypothetical protein
MQNKKGHEKLQEWLENPETATKLQKFTYGKMEKVIGRDKIKKLVENNRGIAFYQHAHRFCVWLRQPESKVSVVLDYMLDVDYTTCRIIRERNLVSLRAAMITAINNNEVIDYESEYFAKEWPDWFNSPRFGNWKWPL